VQSKHQPFCQDAIERGFDVLVVCKPSSHPLLYEWVADFERTDKVQKIERTYWDGKQRFTECLRYVNQVPLRDSDDSLLLNWCEVTISNAKGEVSYKNAWVTTHLITNENVAEIVTAGRTRWKIELVLSLPKQTKTTTYSKITAITLTIISILVLSLSKQW